MPDPQVIPDRCDIFPKSAGGGPPHHRAQTPGGVSENTVTRRDGLEDSAPRSHFTPGPDGEPWDHRSVHPHEGSLFYMDTVGGIGFAPEEYVDISAVIDVKIEMLSQHKSQIEFMRERDGFDLVDYVRTSAKYRGYQCGVRYAEGFVPERVYPSLRPRRILP